MKKVLITGGSRGIGEACVRLFSKNGYKVFFTFVASDDKAKKLSEETGAVAFRCDVSDSSDVNVLYDEIKKHCHCLDCIVNNAGIAQQKLFTELTENDWDRMFDINVKGTFLISKAFAKDMIQNRNGSIVNISSIWGLSGASCEVHYSASKSAVIGFTKALADELGPSGIRVNCVAPGVINTDMNAHLSAEDITALAEETPLLKTGSPEEVAETVFYLSDRASFITGEVIKVSGGF